MSLSYSKLCTLDPYLIQLRSQSVTVSLHGSWLPVCSLTSSPTMLPPVHFVPAVPTWQASCSLGALMNYTFMHNKLSQHLASWDNKALLFLSFWGSESQEGSESRSLIRLLSSFCLWLQCHLKAQLGEVLLLSSFSRLLASLRSSWIWGLRASFPPRLLARHSPQFLAAWASL